MQMSGCTVRGVQMKCLSQCPSESLSRQWQSFLYTDTQWFLTFSGVLDSPEHVRNAYVVTPHMETKHADDFWPLILGNLHIV